MDFTEIESIEHYSDRYGIVMIIAGIPFGLMMKLVIPEAEILFLLLSGLFFGLTFVIVRGFAGRQASMKILNYEPDKIEFLLQSAFSSQGYTKGNSNSTTYFKKSFIIGETVLVSENDNGLVLVGPYYVLNRIKKILKRMSNSI